MDIKYDGYIKKQQKQIERFKKMEGNKLPKSIDYNEIEGLRAESREKLTKMKPSSLGAASRISGVSPADINVLFIYLEKERRLGKGKQ